MDIQVRYNKQVKPYNSISTFEQLVDEICKEYKGLKYSKINFTYLDEEGDEIQVSNTSDMLAISNPENTVLDVQVEGDSAEAQMKREIQEQLNQELQHLTDVIRKKKSDIDACESRLEQEEKKYNTELKNLPDPKQEFPPEIAEHLKQKGFFEYIREKEGEILHVEEEKTFNNQLEGIRRNILAKFEAFYNEERMQKFLKNYLNWKSHSLKTSALEQDHQKEKQRLHHQLATLNADLKQDLIQMDNLKQQLYQHQD